MKKVWILFLLIILIPISAVFILIHGVEIDNIALPKLKVERLYIKLDKKLIVRANKIVFKRESRANTSVYEINKMFSYLKYLKPIFKSISLKNLVYNDEKVNILYKDDIFYVDSKFLTVDAKISKHNKNIILDLKQMILKDYQLELVGELNLDLKNRIYNYNGKLNLLNIDGHLKAKVEKDRLFYEIKSKTFDSLVPIMKYLKKRVFIEPLARAWIYKKIVAKKYRLNYLKGMFDLKTKDFFPKFMDGSASAIDVDIKFHPNVTKAHAKAIDIKLKDNALIFHPKIPTYEGKSIGINDIHIYNLLTTKNGIVVDIKSNTLLDKPVHNILKAFDINIPIKQTKGQNRSNLILDVKFRPFAIDAKGTFVAKDSNFALAGVNFFTKYAHVRLDNDKVYLDNSNLRYRDIFDINTTGKFSVKSSKYKGFIDIKSLAIDIKKSHLIEIKNLKHKNINLSFNSKKTSIFLKDFNSTIIFQKKSNIFKVDDILKFKKYSNFLNDQNFTKGSLTAKTEDFKNFHANLKVQGISSPIIENGKNIKDFNISIDVNSSKIKASSLQGKLQLFDDRNIILNLHDLNLSIDSSNDNLKTKQLFSINGKNVNFVSKDLNLSVLSDNFTLNLDKNETRFISIYKNSQLGFEKNATNFSANGSKFDDQFINTVLNKNMFHKGSFSFSSKGMNKNIFGGIVKIKNSTLKNFSVFNNIIATINTIPSLFLFKDPNFSEKGYMIKDGTISFKKINDVIALKEIKLQGFSANIEGSGYVNLDTKNINLTLQIKTLKDIGKLIGNIPIIGYITLGEDKSFSTHIKVSGDLNNPKIDTEILKDSILSPFNIIKRVLKTPLKLFQ